MSRLEHPERAPFDVVGSVAKSGAGPYALRTDTIRYPDGAEVPYHVITNPDSVFVVPYFDGGDTMLVRQWRHAWNASSWEVPAGTSNPGEPPLDCARRELAEETGLRADRFTSLGIARGSAVITGRAHLFLAEGLTEAEQNREAYEQDMEVRRLPLKEAIDAALDGEVMHSTSVTALLRAARALKLL